MSVLPMPIDVCGSWSGDRPSRHRFTWSPSVVCGRLTAGTGVALRRPDRVCTTALPGAVTGLGTA